MAHLMDKEEGKKVLLEVSGVLGELKVPFFLIQGTALGAWRDKGFTPTERDIDLGVLQEHLSVDRAVGLLLALMSRGYDVEAFVQPLGKIHTVVGWKGSAKVDVVGFSLHQGWRYTPQPVRPWVEKHYCIVHPQKVLESLRGVEMFGREFMVPHPVEEYLLREYGEDWRTPREDHVSRTRVYGFLDKEGPCKTT